MTAASTGLNGRVAKWVRGLQRNPMTLWLLPSLLSALVLLVPFVNSIYYSFTDYHALQVDQTQWVGLENWVRMFRTRVFREVLGVTLRFWGISLLFELPLGFAVALLLSRDLPGIGILRSILVIPIMIPTVVTALIWQIMMNPMDGVLNFFLIKLGGTPWLWLSSGRTVLYSLAVMDMWWGIAFVALLLCAALQSVSDELYECAMIDGASVPQRFLFITLPLMTPYLVLASIFRTIDLFKVFGMIWVATEGGPGRASMTLHMESYDRAFRTLEMGSALPYALVLTIMLIVVVFFLEYVYGRARRFVGDAQ